MRLAIIGCGLIGQKRAAAITSDVELVACFDINSEVAAEFSSRFKVPAFASIEELLEIENLKAVIIATRHDSLAKLSILALKAGVNVFVEKPGALSYEGLKEVSKTAHGLNLKVHVGYNHQFHPSILRAHELVKSGSIGELMFIRGRYGHGGRLGYEKEWRADKQKSGGGELIDQGTHLIDLSLSFMENIELDYATVPNYFWEMPVEDNAFIALKNAKGNIAFLQASCTEWKNMFSLEVYGKAGKLEINGLGRSYGIETLTFHKMLPEMGPPISETWTYPEPDNSWGLEIDEFIQDIKLDTNKSDNLESSLEVLRIIGEIYARNDR